MEQMTLWELLETTESTVNPIWEQLDPAVKTDVILNLSRLMAKTISRNRNEIQNEQENNHDQ